MKTQVDLSKFYVRQKSSSNSPATQNLCQYKFYPTYMAATVVQSAPNSIIQMKAEDMTCNEAASRFISENRTELQPRELAQGLTQRAFEASIKNYGCIGLFPSSYFPFKLCTELTD
ncbi:hypothetical protein L6164_025403 [Bauhinia variegata]|uniref:Uncharacterized protein n=1 Tax=Bauhinia variegata TaxID=167791 RepID=A0ACB9M3N1_BAUVA|nr:hypothetical protein L6164_025403 [Bauhinia variegata]